MGKHDVNAINLKVYVVTPIHGGPVWALVSIPSLHPV